MQLSREQCCSQHVIRRTCYRARNSGCLSVRATEHHAICHSFSRVVLGLTCPWGTRACRASTAVYLLLGWLWGLCRSSVAWELLHDFTTLRRFLTQSGVGVKGFRLMYRESLCELYCNTGYAALLLIVGVSEWRAVLDSARLLRSLA